jgi:CDP-paratose 2-epimerase
MEEEQPFAGCSSRGIGEEFPLQGSRSLYGATKLASELMVEEYHAFFGLKTVINRCGVIAGPWQMGKVDQGVIALWMANHFWQKPLQYIGFGGQGMQVRDVLHIADLYRLVDYELHHPDVVNGQTFNAGGGPGCSVSLAELTHHCQQLTGHRVSITVSPTDRPGDIPIYITNNSKLTAATGWKPEKTIMDVLTDTYHWMRDNEALLRPVFA